MKMSHFCFLVIAVFTLFMAGLSVAATSADYVSVPPFLEKGADANVLLDLSIETPMQGAAYNDQPDASTGCSGRVWDSSDDIGICYSPTQEYLGIFDSSKCYSYSSNRFNPVGSTNASYECSGQWSGNFLNWATMTAIDEFRWALTGGNRVVDSTSVTVIQRANMGLGIGHSWYPVKMLTSTHNVAPSTVTPYTDSKLYIYNHGYQVDIGTTRGAHDLAQNLYVRAKVCDPSQGLEANCVDYGTYYKPEGLIQNNADHMRFALMGYANDNDMARGGGVLRSNMKYVGPYLPGGTVNSAAEYGTNGIFITNPEGASEGQSGVINYLNKFGANGYKSYDPAGELFYECINFFKNRGPTPEYIDGDLYTAGIQAMPSAFKDGFPIITNWQDPIQYECQKNFIIGINDANPWLDKKLPGTHFTGPVFNGYTLRSNSDDWGEPGNPDPDIDVTLLTNIVGDLQGITGTHQNVGATDNVADMNNTSKLIPGLGEVVGTAPWPPKENSYYIAGLAYYANTFDLRTDFPGRQTINTFMIDTQEYSSSPLTGQMNMLWLAGKYGGFNEVDFNDTNGDTNIYEPNDPSEWDRDGDGVPDNYVLATNPKKMINALSKAFYEVNKQMSSGTSASVVSNTRSGEGAIYQSVFYPQRLFQDGADDYILDWAGQVHGLFIDAHGNMREDTTNPGFLDLASDLFIRFNGTTVEKYADVGADGQFGADEISAGPTYTGGLDSINYLWSSTDWLNDDSAFTVAQRSYTDTTSSKRHIFTFIDSDGDMVADGSLDASGSEVLSFTAGTTGNRSDIAPYLHAYEPFAYTAASPPPGIAASDFSTYLDHQADRVINWVRGEDQGALSFGSSVIPPMRSRYYVEGGTGKTWRLGDIINSTPTVVGRPAENFDLLYYDRSYSDFYSEYKNRRNVVYFGANDGMLHAFNAGFYDPIQKAYLTHPQVWDSSTSSYIDDTANPKVKFDLGAEMWAYVPHNLLPHLYWLTDLDYGHVYYNDLKPKIFDANIFPNDATHPGGWGTVLVAGMRFGGGKIKADLNKNGIDDDTGNVMTSAYSIFDITDPEVAPKLLGEITVPGLGFTTNYPMVVAMRDVHLGGSTNDWYLLFGSGPANAAGEPDATALAEAASAQKGKVFLLNLNSLASVPSGSVCFEDSSGNCSSPAAPIVTFSSDADGFISDAIGVDWDIDFMTDTVYFGTVSGNETAGWGGKLRRIDMQDNPSISTTNWDFDNVFLDLSAGSVSGSSPAITTGQLITAAASAGLDKAGNRWVFFGTGRYLTKQDAYNSDKHSFYGLKETRDSSGTLVTLNRANDLFDSTNIKVYETGSVVKNLSATTNYSLLQSSVDALEGWFMDFTTAKERNIGQATLLGKILTFTTYIPSDVPCEVGGESWVYALDYETGTAYKGPVIGIDATDTSDGTSSGKKKVLKKQLIGQGLATSPGLHTGREAGAKAFIQSSTGAIQTFEEATPGRTKSGMSSWQAE